MELYIDSADLKEIGRLVSLYPVVGVTTNPSIISRAKDADFPGLLLKIRALIGDDRLLFVQVTDKTADGMLTEAKAIRETIPGALSIKIPVSAEGLKAMSLVKSAGIGVTATAIFSPMQALLSANSGADFVAPYVNRLDNNGGDGLKLVSEIRRIFDLNNLKTKILSASFRNTDQIKNVILAGSHAVTVSTDLFGPMVSHLLTTDAVGIFDRDWASVYGEKTLLELLGK